MGKITICFASDENYILPLCATIASILYNKAKDDEIVFYLLDSGISEKSRNTIDKLKSIADFEMNYIHVEKSMLKNFPMEEGCHLVLETYYRLLLPDLLPEHEEKVIYLDCDIIVNGSLKEFYETDLEGYYFAGVRNISTESHEKRLGITKYCNAGVLLMNIKALRTIKFMDICTEWVTKNLHIIKCHDQDVINACFHEKLLYVDNKWNTQLYPGLEYSQKDIENAGIIHCIGKKKPWNYAALSPYARLFYKYLALTPLKNDMRIICLRYMPEVFVRNVLKFIFQVRNESKEVKSVRILGFKFHINRAEREEQCV